MLGKNLLTAERTISAASSIRIPANIAVCVTNVVPVFLVEGIICNLVKAAPPKHEAFFQVQTNTLEEQSVLETTVVFKMSITTQGSMEVGHAGGEML
jgi:hypothetical protein